MARQTEIENRKYIGASVSPSMLSYIKHLHVSTGIGVAEYLRRLVQADMTKQHSASVGASNKSGMAGGLTGMQI